MSNVNNEIDYGDLTSVLSFAFEQMLKGVYTVMPGIIRSYNPTTKRARVEPAIQLQRTDGTMQSRPQIANVPVNFPSGGGFVFLPPIAVGDSVICLFSQRGLSRFKETFDVSAPDEGFFDIKDAMVIPGFGSLEITPASTTGACMQSEDGENAIIVENDGVTIQTSGNVKVDCDTMTVNGNVEFNGATLTHNGTNIGSDHRHSGVESGGDNSGEPI